jgi:hypothetical protein
MLKTYSACATNKKPEPLNDNLQETGELIKILVTSIKTAEKKKMAIQVFDLRFLKTNAITLRSGAT